MMNHKYSENLVIFGAPCEGIYRCKRALGIFLLLKSLKSCIIWPYLATLWPNLKVGKVITNYNI